MKLDCAPPQVLVRLLQLDRHAARLAEQAEAAEREVAAAREYLSGRREDPRVDFAAIQAGFATRLQEAKRLRAAADAEQRVLSSAKLWLERLPSDAELEPVEPPVDLEVITKLPDGQALADVRRRKAAVAAEIRLLNSVPVPSGDLKARIESYVAELGWAGRPDVRGVEGGQPAIHWPGIASADRTSLSGFGTERGNALLMTAYLFPERLTEALMATVDAETSKPMPPAQRVTRVGELERELEQLGRVEVALVDAAIAEGADEVHGVDAAPEVILGCRVRVRAEAAA